MLPYIFGECNMKTAHAVIGAGFGDEGKGLAVDKLTHSLLKEHDSVTVVRSNGGAQAGHGVELADGTRHVFHHVGSGSFAGGKTHLSRFFVSHPILFFKEIEELQKLGVNPVVSVDPRSPITTPYEMFLNQISEKLRGDERHGSCGLGFGETLEREEKGPSLTFESLGYYDLKENLRNIREHWLPKRMDQILSNIGKTRSDIPKRLMETILSDSLLDRFVDDAQAYYDFVGKRHDSNLSSADVVLFEGAQGLRLDQDLGHFPHVTRSNTGLQNMVSISKEAGIEEIIPVYMTRCYVTRHGAGPLPNEQKMSRWVKVVDKTNVPNPWQGKIRLAPLNLDTLDSFIRRDINRVRGEGISIDSSIGMSCLDQLVDHNISVYADGREMELTPDRLMDKTTECTGLQVRLFSYGPTREAVNDIKEWGRRISPLW